MQQAGEVGHNTCHHETLFMINSCTAAFDSNLPPPHPGLQSANRPTSAEKTGMEMPMLNAAPPPRGAGDDDDVIRVMGDGRCGLQAMAAAASVSKTQELGRPHFQG